MQITNRSWTPEDLDTLKKHVADGSSPARVAVNLKRSITSVQSKARLEGFPFPHSRDVKRDRLAKEAAARSELGLSAEGDL
jgi:hypothetical protein